MASNAQVKTDSSENSGKPLRKKEMDYYVPPKERNKSKKGKNKNRGAEHIPRGTQDTRTVKFDHHDLAADLNQSRNEADHGQEKTELHSSRSNSPTSSPEKNYSTAETPRHNSARNHSYGTMYSDREPQHVTMAQKIQQRTSQEHEEPRDMSHERRTQQSQSPQDTQYRNFQRENLYGDSPQSASGKPWTQGTSQGSSKHDYDRSSRIEQTDSNRKRNRSSSGGRQETRSRQEQRSKYCKWCNGMDHGSDYCPVLYCGVCREEGHTFRDRDCQAVVRPPYLNNVRTIKGKDDILSNFYDCKVSIDGYTFQTSENAYHYRKATLCGDYDTARSFTQVRSAFAGKYLSRDLKGKLPADWDDRKVGVMKEVLWAKFEQVPEFRKDLLGTGEKILAHSLTDRYWGTGLDTEDTMATYPEYWPGQNIHGVMLMDLRDQVTGKRTQKTPNYKVQTTPSSRPWSRGTPHQLDKRDDRSNFSRMTPQSTGSSSSRDVWPRNERQVTSSSDQSTANSKDTSLSSVNQPELTKQTTCTQADEQSATAPQNPTYPQESSIMQQPNLHEAHDCPETWDLDESIPVKSPLYDVQMNDPNQQPAVLASMNTQPNQTCYGPPQALALSTNQGQPSQGSISEQDSKPQSSGSENPQASFQEPSNVESREQGRSHDSDPNIAMSENTLDSHDHSQTLTPVGEQEHLLEKQQNSDTSSTAQIPEHGSSQHDEDDTSPKDKSGDEWSTTKRKRNRVQGAGWNKDTQHRGGRGRRSHQEYQGDRGKVGSPVQGQSQGRSQHETSQSYKGDREDTGHQGGRGGQYEPAGAEDHRRNDHRRTGGRYNHDADYNRGGKQNPRSSQSQEQRFDDRRGKHGNQKYKEQDPAKRLDSFSRSLSTVLRHRAEELGFNIQTDGFIYVKELLEHHFFSKHDYSYEELRHVVHNNDKKRFLMIEDESGRLKIRANQGHTMAAMAIPMKKITDAGQWADVVHGTYYECLGDIKKKGLNRRGRNHIHFAPGEPGKDDEVISGMRGSCDVVIYIDMAAAIADGFEFFLSENNVILTAGDKHGNLPSKYFSKILDRETREEV